MKDELLDETELYPFADDEKGVSFLVRLDGYVARASADSET